MVNGGQKLIFYFIRLILFLNLLAVICLLGSYGASYIDPQKICGFAILGLLYPILLIINIFFVFLWLFLWKKYALLSLVSILIGWNHLTSLVPFNFENRVMPPAENFVLTTYNVHQFTGANGGEEFTRPDIIQFFMETKPQILCFQDFAIREADYPRVLKRMAMKWQLPHYQTGNYIYDKKTIINGLATFTTYPLLRSQTLLYPHNNLFAIYSDLVVGYDTIRVFNVHLASIRFDHWEYSFYDQLKNRKTENLEIKQGFFTIIGKLQKAFVLRSQQVNLLLAKVDESPYPVIIAGDFNDSPFSYSYRRMTRHFRDSFQEAGKGIIGNTYAGNLPSYRIDYILYDSGFDALSYKKYPVKFSDHYPISASIIIEN